MFSSSGGVSITTPVFHTTNEVADLLKVHVKTIREMIKSGRLQAVRVGKEYRITEDQVRRYIGENSTGRPDQSTMQPVGDVRPAG